MLHAMPSEGNFSIYNEQRSTPCNIKETNNKNKKMKKSKEERKKSVKKLKDKPKPGMNNMINQLRDSLKQPFVKMVHCPVCGKQIHNNPGVTRHMRDHTGDYSIRCNICQQGFHQRERLNYHMKKQHQSLPIKEE